LIPRIRKNFYCIESMETIFFKVSDIMVLSMRAMCSIISLFLLSPMSLVFKVCWLFFLNRSAFVFLATSNGFDIEEMENLSVL